MQKVDFYLLLFATNIIFLFYPGYGDLRVNLYHYEGSRSQVNDSEIITTSIVSSLYFGGHQDKARQFMKMAGMILGMLDKSRAHSSGQA
jgi:hypothetical protein